MTKNRCSLGINIMKKYKSILLGIKNNIAELLFLIKLSISNNVYQGEFPST